MARDGFGARSGPGAFAHEFVSTPGVLAVIDGVLAGVLTGIVVPRVGVHDPPPSAAARSVPAGGGHEQVCMPRATLPGASGRNMMEVMVDPCIHRVGGQLRPLRTTNEVLNDA